MSKRVWKIRDSTNSESILGSLFAVRGLGTDADVKKFLDPQYADHHDPFSMAGMDLAASRIEKALKDNEKITIYADYDADAVTAAAVLLRFFQHVQYKNVDYYIPDRFTEGYGMNPEAVKTLSERGTKLVITVDCGINAFESAREANKLGIDVIITDHHQLTGGGVPAAVAVVNPHRPDDTYPFKDLTGVGVAFKLVQALVLKLKIAAGWEKWLLDLVAIGTVADCQSLLGENRIFVKWGIVVMEKTRSKGLRALFDIAGVSGSKICTYQIGFIIAPRINAAGRIEHANLALELLLTDDASMAERLARKLQELNRRRQELTEQILSEAREQLVPVGNQKILLAAGNGWPKGIVGLVAGKLTEEFARPVLILAQESGEATGSARSVANFNIVEAISHSKDILVRYGGHPMAAGFTLRSEHIELFQKNLLDYADKILSEDSLAPVIYYDGEVAFPDINETLVEILEKFAPFGVSNPRPRFRMNNCIVDEVRAIGADGKHLRITCLPQAGRELGCIGFNLGFWAEKLNRENKNIDIICEPQFNVWNGKKNIQLRIVDLKFSNEE